MSFIDGYKVCICNTCGFGFAADIPEQAEFNRYYKECSKYDCGIAYESGEADFPVYIDIISRYLPDQSVAILEVGCAIGKFLVALKKAGFTNLVGVDPSPECVNHVSALGIPCICATIDDLEATENFDAILLFATLEHLCDLNSSMHKFKSLLKNNGLMFIMVPDAMTFSVGHQPPFQEFSIEHINYFSAQSLANLAIVHECVQLETIAVCESRGVLSVIRKHPSNEDIIFDEGIKLALTQYIQKSEIKDISLERIISAFYGKSLVVWGIGTYTRHLLAKGVLTQCEIRAFVDNNPHLLGGAITVNGINIPIITPDLLEVADDIPICIGSQYYQREIASEIRQRLKLKNRIVFLF